jgi:ABC-type transport system substrate-binding protein
MPGYKPLEQSIRPNRGTDLEKIKQTLTPDIVPQEAIEIVCAYQSPRVERELDLVQKFWARLGISLKVKYVTDWSEFEAYLKSDAVQIFRYAWFADMPDPDSFLYPLFASQSSVNFTRYQNLKVDQLLDEAREIINPVKRAKIYQKTEELIMASTPIIPLFYLSIDRVYQPNVQGIQISALGAHTMPLHRVWLKPAAESTK